MMTPTHSVVSFDAAGYPVVTMTLTVADGEVVDSSAKLRGTEVAAYLERRRYRWAVAIADGGAAFRFFGTPLAGEVTFEALTAADRSIVLVAG